jgi:hypothetical protein
MGMDIRTRSGASPALQNRGGEYSVAFPTIHLNGQTVTFRADINLPKARRLHSGRSQASDPSCLTARGSRHPMGENTRPQGHAVPKTISSSIDKDQRRLAYNQRCAAKETRELRKGLESERKARLASKLASDAKDAEVAQLKESLRMAEEWIRSRQLTATPDSEAVLRLAAADQCPRPATFNSAELHHVAQHPISVLVFSGAAGSALNQQQCPADSDSDAVLRAQSVDQYPRPATAISAESELLAQKRSSSPVSSAVAAGVRIQEQRPATLDSEAALQSQSLDQYSHHATIISAESDSLVQKRSSSSVFSGAAANQQRCPAGSESEAEVWTAASRSQDLRTYQAASRSERLAQNVTPGSHLSAERGWISNQEWKAMIDAFQRSKTKFKMDLPPRLVGGQRREAHKMCARLGLRHETRVVGDGSFIHISRFTHRDGLLQLQWQQLRIRGWIMWCHQTISAKKTRIRFPHYFCHDWWLGEGKLRSFTSLPLQLLFLMSTEKAREELKRAWARHPEQWMIWFWHVADGRSRSWIESSAVVRFDMREFGEH